MARHRLDHLGVLADQDPPGPGSHPVEDGDRRLGRAQRCLAPEVVVTCASIRRTSSSDASPPGHRSLRPRGGASLPKGQNAHGFILARGRGCLLRPTREELNVEETSGFWADAIGLAASPVAIAAGIAKGSYDAATGSGAFDEGFHAAADPIITSARKFGTEHKDTITKGLLGGAAATVGARIVNEGLRHLKR
jgi:hypothetical protein